MNLKRRDFMAATAATACWGAPGLPALAQALTPIRVVGVPIDVSAEPFYAQDQGFFKKVGLVAEITTMGNGAQIIAALAGGSLDFGAGGTTSIALAREHGIPVVVVAPAGAYSSKVRTHGLLVRADGPIHTPRDLPGKTFAGSALKTIADVAFRAWLAKYGVDYNTLKHVEMPYAEQYAALASGRVDAIDLEDPFLSQALAQPNVRFLGGVFDGIAPEWVEGAYFCMEDYAKANPDTVKKFAEAIALAAAWANKNGAAAWKVLDAVNKTVTPPDRPHAYYPERLRVADFQPLLDASAKYGVLQKTFPAREMFAPGLGD